MKVLLTCLLSSVSLLSAYFNITLSVASMLQGSVNFNIPATFTIVLRVASMSSAYFNMLLGIFSMFLGFNT